MANDKFCSKCGSKLEVNSISGVETQMESSNDAEFKPKLDLKEILENSQNVWQEYEGKKTEWNNTNYDFWLKEYKKARDKNKLMKGDDSIVLGALEEKALVRFVGHFKHTSPFCFEVCATEKSFLFLQDRRIIAPLLQSEIKSIHISRFDVEYQLGLGRANRSWWQIHFVTKWADLQGNEYRSAVRHSLANWKIKNGEFDYFIEAGETTYQQEKITSSMLSKIEVLKLLYPIELDKTLHVYNQSVGLVYMPGFWHHDS